MKLLDIFKDKENFFPDSLNAAIQEFSTHGVKKSHEAGTSESLCYQKCEDNEAEFFGIYALTLHNEEKCDVWVADLPTREWALRVAQILTAFKKEYPQPVPDVMDSLMSFIEEQKKVFLLQDDSIGYVSFHDNQEEDTFLTVNM